MYVVIGRTLSQVMQPKRITAVINLWRLFLITPLAWMALQKTGIPHVDASLWWLLLFYGLAASVGTIWLWMTGSRHIPASQAGIFTTMLPIRVLSQ
ncbi:MAG: hypothetical protein EXR35_05880 [Limnohabitans sp.]|nr:hypothetical protein [Limnohabitans sp.]